MLTTSVVEAIFDAGLNLSEIRDKTIGIFGASSFVETDKDVLHHKCDQYGFGMLGLGPSCTIQSEYVGSVIALKKAFESIKSGDCEAAIVEAGIIGKLPDKSYHFKELELLSPNGINRSFDAKASGFTCSESVGVLFLQKAKNEKRIYAEISAINVEYGEHILDKNITFNTAKFQAQIMRKTLNDCNLKPSDVTCIEANGTAVKKIDREELKAIDLVYGKDRSPSNPILIGSVLIAMEKDIIPPNLHYDEPPEDAKCLQDGRVKVVTKPINWAQGYAAVNTGSFNGIFSHIILKRHSKNKRKKELSTEIMPRLFVASARNKEMLTLIFDSIKKNKADEDLIQLLNDIMKEPIRNSLFRGYIVMKSTKMTESEEFVEKITSTDEQSKNIWFVFFGMGSQWTGMGQSLMKIPLFEQAIIKCDNVLRPRGYDIMHIICNNDPTIRDNIIKSFLGITALQIGLVDILYAIGVKPRLMIGHSVAELGCSYADDCFTAESTSYIKLSFNKVNLALTKRGHKDSATLVLSTLGKLDNLGITLKVGNIYPRIPYTVCKGTPSISSLIRWENSDDWYVNYYEEFGKLISLEKTFMLDLNLNEYKFLRNFKIASGQFKVLTSNTDIISTGTISIANKYTKQYLDKKTTEEGSDELSEKDFYTDLLICGYKYGDFYKSINGLSFTLFSGQLKWNKNWIPLLEALFQILIYNSNNKHLLMPYMIQKIVINNRQLEEKMLERDGKKIAFVDILKPVLIDTKPVPEPTQGSGIETDIDGKVKVYQD
ncbi:hypothetical protein M0802_016152 [Mischocyttarus mexicanus]|nr:hypothetical protein M0802_016152 [Mischocyttarus mexicanus]